MEFKAAKIIEFIHRQERICHYENMKETTMKFAIKLIILMQNKRVGNHSAAKTLHNIFKTKVEQDSNDISGLH